MNEYDDILNRIVEEFYDTGKLILEGRWKRLTNDELRNIAKKYNTKSEWNTNDRKSYIQAHRRDKKFPGFWEDITSHMIVLNKHLTNDELRNIALNYETRGEWSKKDVNSYRQAYNRDKKFPGFYEDITSHMKSSLLTNDELRNIAKKYNTKIEWKKNDPNTYEQAHRRDKKFPGFYEDITSHMKSSSLTNDELRNIAKKYRTRSEWNTNDQNSYVQAHRRDKNFPGFWEDITSHMEIINASPKHIYAYEFYDKENNPIAVYVGLTCDMTRRNKEHQTGYCAFGKEETQVFKFIKENPKLKYEIKLLEPNQYEGREAEQKEIEWEEKYRHNGWRTLNIAKPGSLGGLYKLTKDELRNIAKKYRTKIEWNTNDPNTYDQAYRRDKNFPGFWEDITSHMKSSSLTNDELRNIAKKYNTKIEWKKSVDGNAYRSALRRGKDFYEDITSHMKSSSLTNDELRNIAKKYNTKIEWMENDRNSYVQAYNRDKKIPGFWEDITSHMGSDDILNRIVEEFYDTGKLKLSEDIEFDVDDEDFGVESEEEIEITDNNVNINDIEIGFGVESEEDYIEKEYGWLTGGTKFDTMTNGITNKNVFKAKYILTNEIKKGNSLVYLRNNFLEFLNKVNAILGTNIKITEDTFLRMTTRYLENTKDVYGLSDEQIKKWVEAKKENIKKNQLKPLKREKIEERFDELKEYLNRANVWEMDYTKNELLDDFGLKVKNFEFSEIINAFEGNPTKEFYLKFISKIVDDEKTRAYWGTFVKYSKGINEIITNNKIPDEQIKLGKNSTQKYTESLKTYFEKIKNKEYCYIFSNNCKLSSSDIEKVMDFFGETYENSFLNKGFKKESKSVESRIHNLGDAGFSFSEKIKSDDFDVDKISKYIIKNIENYLKGKDSIIKYDLLADGDIKDEGGNVIIPKDGKVEVKDINNQDSYLSEFLSSPVKKTEYGVRNNPIYLKRYNEVIGKVYDYINKNKKEDIIDKIKVGLSGIIISNNIYVPNENNNIEFYLSNVGRSNPEKQLRISVRYHINKNNWRNFYKIGDDGILYPLKKEPNIPTKEKRIYETKSKLDNIIENFFDTGKFVF